MSKEMEFFSTLFEKHPNIAILNINNNCDDIKLQLENLVNEIGGTLKNKEFSEIDQNKFRLTAREFEYGVICDILHNIENKDKFIKEIYHSLENSAHIIVICKKENMDPYTISEILDRNDFRAVNHIDIFDHYHLVMAKKMHMWGNGL